MAGARLRLALERRRAAIRHPNKVSPHLCMRIDGKDKSLPSMRCLTCSTAGLAIFRLIILGLKCKFSGN